MSDALLFDDLPFQLPPSSSQPSSQPTPQPPRPSASASTSSRRPESDSRPRSRSRPRVGAQGPPVASQDLKDDLPPAAHPPVLSSPQASSSMPRATRRGQSLIAALTGQVRPVLLGASLQRPTADPAHSSPPAQDVPSEVTSPALPGPSPRPSASHAEPSQPKGKGRKGVRAKKSDPATEVRSLSPFLSPPLEIALVLTLPFLLSPLHDSVLRSRARSWPDQPHRQPSRSSSVPLVNVQQVPRCASPLASEPSQLFSTRQLTLSCPSLLLLFQLAASPLSTTSATPIFVRDPSASTPPEPSRTATPADLPAAASTSAASLPPPAAPHALDKSHMPNGTSKKAQKPVLDGFDGLDRTCHMHKSHKAQPRMTCLNAPDCRTVWCTKCVVQQCVPVPSPPPLPLLELGTLTLSSSRAATSPARPTASSSRRPSSSAPSASTSASAATASADASPSAAARPASTRPPSSRTSSRWRRGPRRSLGARARRATSRSSLRPSSSRGARGCRRTRRSRWR